MAIQMCNHIIDLKDANHQAVLLKGLDYLDLSTADPSIIPTLINLASKIVKVSYLVNCPRICKKKRVAIFFSP